MKLSRLRGRKICDRVQRTGILWKGKTLWMRYVLGHPRHPAAVLTKNAIYVGTLTSTKLDKSAVKRNRMRRRCREALRTLVLPLDTFPTLQLLILPRSSSLSAPFPDIEADVRSFLSHIHGKRQENQ